MEGRFIALHAVSAVFPENGVRRQLTPSGKIVFRFGRRLRFGLVAETEQLARWSICECLERAGRREPCRTAQIKPLSGHRTL
jgi:hypothetical protein